MNSKTIQKHIARLQAKTPITKNEIGAIIKGLNAERFSKHGLFPALAMEDKLSDALEPFLTGGERDWHHESNSELQQLLFKKPLNITPEQSELGIDWLKKFCLGVRGPRKQSAFNEDDLNVIINFKSFQFVGVLQINNDYGHCSYLPIYRTHGHKGASFDYSPIHWGTPIVMNRIVSKRRAVA